MFAIAGGTSSRTATPATTSRNNAVNKFAVNYGVPGADGCTAGRRFSAARASCRIGLFDLTHPGGEGGGGCYLSRKKRQGISTAGDNFDTIVLFSAGFPVVL